METTFGKIGNVEPVFTSIDTSNYIPTCNSLPSIYTESLKEGQCYFKTRITNTTGDGLSGIYKIVNVSGVKKWELINPNTLSGSFAIRWSSDEMWRRITSDSIILHWKSAVDDDDALRQYWDHEVIVKKRGTAPTTPTDGEIVGYSFVPNQYYDDLSSESSINPGFVAYLAEGDDDYIFKVFTVSISGSYTPCTSAMKSTITWAEIRESVDLGTYKKLLRVGDIFPMPQHATFGQLYAQIVAFDNGPSRSITFMTTSVLRNMSFDNKELKYAKTFDSFFKKNKKYFVYESGEYKEFNLTYEGFNYGDSIPAERYWNGGTSGKELYELHPSIRYFVNLLGSFYENQSSVYTGCGFWNRSNLRDWLSQEKGSNVTGTTESVDSSKWARMNSLGYNGWFYARLGNYHNVAPGSISSATYVEIPRFQNGFSDTVWLSYITDRSNITISDGYVYRFNRSSNNLDDLIRDSIIESETSHPGAVYVNDGKFWIPSFEEIYGKRPKSGHNGIIDTSGISSTHEGTQFELFAKSRENRIRFGPDGRPMKWYLRSCDPTTVGRIYYVDNTLPDSDDNSLIDLTCTAHRSTISGEPEIGPVVCFTMATV